MRGKRDQVFVASTLSALWALPVVRVAVRGVLVLHKARRAYTLWKQTAMEHEIKGTLSPEPLYCLGLCLVSLVSLYYFVQPECCEVREDDTEYQPDEEQQWEWCDPCASLRTLDASHCYYCRTCVRNRCLHRFFEFKCVSTTNIRSFLCYAFTDLAVSCQMLDRITNLEGLACLMNIYALVTGLRFYFSPQKKVNHRQVRSCPRKAFSWPLVFPGCLTVKS